ncbi:hypothetical protein [Polyangium jinanense]|uniref:Uncharacterized protein n=1 Tax=Polyangium jinanense TaxID=2829994 RepID=A0A9X3X8N3_9BACT|nr:hypothetical protein [Polyangium jinanense]MDC3984585.1 hypothetical protein [Polyangium jinanense]
MTVKLFASNVDIASESVIEPQDVIDAIATLDLQRKLCAPLSAPGQGPDFFLNWAGEELKEAASSSDPNAKNRKYYNAAVYSKGAVECLVDWYLSKLMLNFTISPFAGIAQKLEALDSESLLGISFSLFNDIVFEPRNRGIHKFELVEEKEAKHGRDLARLTITNCVHHVPPGEAPIIYGNVLAYRGNEALEKIGKERFPWKDGEVFYFAGVGAVGDYAVLLDREHADGRLSILHCVDDGKVDARHCTIRNNFTSEQIRSIFNLLERSKPKPIGGFDEGEIRSVIETLLPDRRPTKRKARVK